MANTSTVRTALHRALRETTRTRVQTRSANTAPLSRSFAAQTRLRKDETSSKYDPATSSAEPGESGKHEGQHARTDGSISVQYPKDADFPPSHLVKGRGGQYHKRTLATFSMEGKTALITGAARGLGLVMAQGLVESGADVAIVDLNVEEAKTSAQTLMDNYRKENPDSEDVPKVTAHKCDVSNPDSVDSCIAEVLFQHGKIDNLVTSAGFTENFEAISYPFDRIKKLWGVNVDGTYLFAVGVAKHLMERKSPGSIVFIGSMSGAIVNVPQPQTPYNASKAAVRHLAASLAVEWADAGIRVNCISPGYMLTALTKKILDDNPELHKKWTSLIPVGKMGRPEDLMGAVAFLSSDASKYVNGADLRVDGAYTVT